MGKLTDLPYDVSKMNKMLLRLTLIFLLVLPSIKIASQTVIKMQYSNGVYFMPCEINGLKLRFIFDTGASNISISLAEAWFMIRNGYLDEDDILETEYYQIANGEIEEGTKIILREVRIGQIIIQDVEASVIHTIEAPLLFGQSALRQLGEFEFDYAKGTLTIIDGPDDFIVVDENETPSAEPTGHLFITYFTGIETSTPLYSRANTFSRIKYYCPIESKIYVLENAEEYFKVWVDGYEGYLDKQNLERKR